jgi:hypothetical protein
MDAVGREETKPREIELFDDLQLLEKDKAGRIGRRLQHLEAAIANGDRLLTLGLKGFEIGLGNEAAGGGEALREAA